MGELLREVNRTIRGLAAEVDPDDAFDWQFVCECGDPGCNEKVGLPLARYDALKGGGVAVVAPGHWLKRAG